MNIKDTISKSCIEFINENLKNKNMIYRAYIRDINEHVGTTPRYFWGQFMSLLIMTVLSIFIIIINGLYIKSNIFMFSMFILNGLAVWKDYFGLSKKMTYGVIHILYSIDEYSYFNLLMDYYLNQEVSEEIKKEIMASFSKEEIIKMTSKGVIRNSVMYQL